jgi:hypothetical protein
MITYGANATSHEQKVMIHTPKHATKYLCQLRVMCQIEV